MFLPQWWGIHNEYPNAENSPDASFPQEVDPPTVDPDSGFLITRTFASEWLPVMQGALDQLLLPSTWKGSHDEKILALNRADWLKAILAHGGVSMIDAPYWDEDSDVGAQERDDTQTWYGIVSNPTVPAAELDFVENALIWGFTGLLALATWEVGAAPAVIFHTIAPKFLLATKRGDVGQIIRILIDGHDAATVDTTPYAAGEVISTPIAGDPSLSGHDIMIVGVT